MLLLIDLTEQNPNVRINLNVRVRQEDLEYFISNNIIWGFFFSVGLHEVYKNCVKREDGEAAIVLKPWPNDQEWSGILGKKDRP